MYLCLLQQKYYYYHDYYKANAYMRYRYLCQSTHLSILIVKDSYRVMQRSQRGGTVMPYGKRRTKYHKEFPVSVPAPDSAFHSLFPFFPLLLFQLYTQRLFCSFFSVILF